MAKKGMRRPDPSEPHGTESNKKNKHPKNQKFREKQNMGMLKRDVYKRKVYPCNG